MISLITCTLNVLAYPTSTAGVVSVKTPTNDVTWGNYPSDDVVTRTVLSDTEPCSRQRMVVCYSLVDSRFNAQVGALVPNLSDTSLGQLCQYAVVNSSSSCSQGSRIRSVRILFFERYVRTLTYSILAYVNKNRIRSWQDAIRIISHGCYQLLTILFNVC